MNQSAIKYSQSTFMLKNIPLLLKRFDLSYYKEGACIEYFINDLFSAEVISSALIMCYNRKNSDLHVSRFYPQLYLLPDSKYLSAACFYLLIQHCANIFAIDKTCHISLETVEKTSDNFYKKLGDFNFVVSKHGINNVVELVSDISMTEADTSMIGLHLLQPGEIAFMK